MAFKQGGRNRPQLGLELHETIVRIVEIKYRGTEPYVSVVGAFTPPEGYLQRDRIHGAEPIGHGLRKLLEQLQVSAVETVVGVPSSVCVTRTFTLPPVADEEMRVIVDGEVNHFQIFKDGENAYDFFRLNTENFADASGASVFLAGVEGRLLDDLKELAAAAGLKLVAAEPTHQALLRAGAQNAERPTALYVTVTETHSNLALVEGDRVALYRTFDFGTDAIFHERRVPAVASEGEVVDPFRNADRRSEEDDSERPEGQLDASVAGMLAVEIRRSVDYFLRELTTPPPTIERLVVASTHPGIDRLTDWLEAVLEADVEASALRATAPMLAELAGRISPDEAYEYTGALGLASRNVPSPTSRDMPRLDLAMQEQLLGAIEVANQKLRITAMVCAATFVVIGGACLLAVYNARSSAAEVARAQVQFRHLQDIRQARVRQEEEMRQRYAALAKDGVPVTDIMSAISSSVPDSAGLTDVRITSGAAELSGEALGDAPVIKLSENLQQKSLVQSVSLTLLERVEGVTGSKGVHFRMLASTGAPPPPVPISPAAAATNGVPQPSGGA